MLGTAAGALLFFSFLIALVIVGSYVLTFAAHCFLVIVQGTAAGSERITWPDDSPLDWLRASTGLLLQVALALAPAGLGGRLLADLWLPREPLLRFLLLGGGALWLLFPPLFLLI